MRNTLQYPLEDQELLAYLERQKVAFQKSTLFGSMDGMILAALIQRVQENPYAPDQITGNVPVTTTTSTITAKN